MDILKLTAEKGIINNSESTVVRIEINGRSLIDLLKEYETPFAQKEGHPSIAGGYSWMEIQMFINSISSMQKDIHTILTCECGEEGCWPMEINIKVNTSNVIWNNFAQPHRKAWTYTQFGAFVFKKGQYQTELNKLKKYSNQ